MFPRTSLSSSGSGHPDLAKRALVRKTSHIARNYILCERLLEYGVLAGTTARTREGSDFNMSYSHAEFPEAYATRLGLWLKDFGFDQAYRNGSIFFLHLVHGTRVLHVNAEAIADNTPGSFVQRCDGLVTALHGESAVVLTAKTADCDPVFLFDRSTCASGLVHCGWRGLRDGVLSGALRSMFESYSCRAPQLLLHMGPFICAQHYEVGAEVAELFPAAVERRGGATYLDLGRIVSDQARAAGIPEANISTADVCTWERDDLRYS